MTGPTLEPGAVLVHRVRLDIAPDELDRRRAWLAEDERTRADRFLSPVVRRRFIALRGRLRELLAAQLNVDPATVAFAYGDQGKPRLADDTADAWLRFNASHSHERGLVALTRKTPVGVDLERRRPLEDVLGLARHVLSEREQSQLRSYAPERREAVFFSFWTRKEAWLKAHGHGLVFGAARLEVTLDPDRDPEVVAIDGVRPAADGWSLVDLDPPAGYRAALAVVGPRPRVEYVDDPYDGPPAEEER